MKLLFMMLLSYSFQIHATLVPGEDLYQYFSQSCQGEFTQAALLDSSALIESLNNMKSDPDCATVSGSISSFNTYQSQVAQLKALNSTQSSLAEIETNEQELLSLLAQTSAPTQILEPGRTIDPSYQDSINLLLNDIQLQRASALAKEKANQNLLSESKTQLMTSAISSVQSAFSQLTANQKCIDKYPGVLKTATSLISTAGSVASLFNPVIGYGLSAGSQFLGTTIEGIRNLIIDRRIRNISDNSFMEQGLKCALQTMSERFCTMIDTESFIHFKDNPDLEKEINEIKEINLRKSLRFVERELPVFLEWLTKIRSGVTPTTMAEAERQNNAANRVSMVQNYQRIGQGLINQRKRQYDDLANSPADQWTYLKNTIKKLVPSSGQTVTSSSDSITNPLTEIYTSDYAPYFLLGFEFNATEIRLSEAQGGGFKPFDSWDQRRPGAIYNLELIKTNYEAWIQDALDLTERERTQVQSPDALGILSAANDATESRYNLSPMGSLLTLINFIKENPPSSEDQSFNKIYKSTLDKLEKIYKIVEDNIILEGIIIEDATYLKNLEKAVTEIYTLAQLDFGTIIVQSRLELIIRLSLLNMIKNSPPDDQSVVAQFMAAERFSDNLRSVTGKDSTVILQDIDEAKGITKNNLKYFGEIFNKNINRILKKIYNEEMLEDPVNKPKEYKMARKRRVTFCHLLLAVPNVERKIDIQYCEGVSFDAQETGGPTTEAIKLSDYEKDLPDRICTFREYYRQSRIYRKWRIK